MPENTITQENELLRDLILENLKEQRRKRRWGIFFKLLFITYLGLMTWLIFVDQNPVPNKLSQPHTSLVDLKGIIFDTEAASADSIVTSLRRAFEDKNTRGIILRINSPGGTPVQANYIYNEIKRLRGIHKNIKLYAVCTDICASAAYYIASAADQIYADPNSIVGSIGVKLDGFGFVNAMEKLGIERRLVTAGEHKGLMDPFSPMSIYDKQHSQDLVNNVYQQFVNKVKAGRGKRLQQNNPEIFSGSIWTGEQALQLGLVDGLGSAGQVAREVIKNEAIVDYSIKPNYFEKLANRLGASFAGELASKAGIGSVGLH